MGHVRDFPSTKIESPWSCTGSMEGHIDNIGRFFISRSASESGYFQATHSR